MEISTFQDRLERLLREAEKKGNALTREQIRLIFEGEEPDREQLLLILRFLKEKGIDIADGKQEHPPAEEPSTGAGLPDNPGTPRKLTKEEREYLDRHLEELSLWEAGQARWLRMAALIASEYNCRELPLADLIQEADISALTALRERDGSAPEEEYMRRQITGGVLEAVRSRLLQKEKDSALVERVEKLDRAVKELTGDEEEEKLDFSLGELAVILDMSEDEIRDTLKLTGDHPDEE